MRPDKGRDGFVIHSWEEWRQSLTNSIGQPLAISPYNIRELRSEVFGKGYGCLQDRCRHWIEFISYCIASVLGGLKRYAPAAGKRIKHRDSLMDFLTECSKAMKYVDRLFVG